MPITHNQKPTSEIREDLEELQLATRAMWEIIKAKTGASDSDLQDMAAKLSFAEELATSAPKADAVEDKIEQTVKPKAEPEPKVEPEVVVDVAAARQANSFAQEESTNEPKPAAPKTEPVESQPKVEATESTIQLPREPSPALQEALPEAEEPVLGEEVLEEEIPEEMVEEAPAASEAPDGAMRVKIRGDRVKCPSCSKIFSVRDHRCWDGVRHLKCDTALIVEGIEELLF